MADNKTKMTTKQTTDHMLRHYKRALQELQDDGMAPDMLGLVAFAHSIEMSLVGQRADLAAINWANVLQHDVNSMLTLGHELYGCPNGHTHEDQDTGS